MNIKTVFVFFTICFLSAEVFAQAPSGLTVAAHRGCWISNEIPENSVDAIWMAKRFGYKVVELDVRYTADSVMVVMHDNSINRTMRKADDYSVLSEPILVAEHTFADLRQNYVLASNDITARRPIPTLEEILQTCIDSEIIPMLHSHICESYVMAQRMLGNNWVCFVEDDSLAMVARKLSDCLILLDLGKNSTDVIERLKAIGGRCGISSMRSALLTADFCRQLRENGFEVQSSIFPTPLEVQAIRNGISILLTDFSYFPPDTLQPLQSWHLSQFTNTESEDVLHLNPGKTLHLEAQEQVSYGALSLKIDYLGSIEICMNGERKYLLNRLSTGSDYIGLRFTNCVATISIIVHEQTTIENFEASLFSFPK